MGLAALQAKLDASPTGSVQGYFKTVLKGSTIETIPVEVLSLTDEADPSRALILFQAKGAKIEAFGGIAAGMSGSPIYVDDEGVDKVIGALSYGESMTLGGTGLATPIEAMLQIRTDYGPRVAQLRSPVLVSGHLVDSVSVGSTKVASAGTFVGTPLARVFVGGLRPRTALYAKLASALEKRGIGVTSIAAQMSSGGSTFSTELVPGAAVGSLAARGAIWVGGFGTVTYTDGDTVLAYGHPAFMKGSTSLFMTNVWVTGVWPSTYEPYKMGYPTAVAGEFTQDRSAGVMGVAGAVPQEVPVFSHAVDVETGREAAEVTYLTSKLLDMGETDYLTYYGASVAAAKLYDADHIPGSADVTTTVVVESEGETFTVVMSDLVDDSDDVVSVVGDDAYWAVYSLLSVLNDGIETPHIVSIDVDSRITSQRRSASIIAVNALAPLTEGDNRVRVSLRAYGLAATQTVDTTLTIPEGTEIEDGVLTAESWYDSDSEEDYDFSDEPMARETVAQIVADLNEETPNNSLCVAFEPADMARIATGEVEPIATTVEVPWATSGYAQTEVGIVTAETSPVTYGDMPAVYGMVYGPGREVEISIYGTPAGSDTESLLATTTTYFDEDAEAFVYEAYLPDVVNNTELHVTMPGGKGYTPAETYALQEVKAYARVTASLKTMWWPLPITLTAHIEPGDTRGSVKFQYYDSRRKAWRTIATKSLKRGMFESKASTRWTPPRGKTKVRVVYGGSFEISGGKSSSITITRH